MEINKLYTLFQKHNRISTDTRSIAKDSLFFALKGDNFDANTFVDEALEKGASYVVIDNETYYNPKDSRYILVNDVLQTLQKLAQYHRQQLGIPIIALTGSNGKTTTKELLHVVLAKKFKITATKGNLNNHIGVPLTLLSMTTETEIGLIEMGANHFDEISFLCHIAQPDFGYITNFGKAHLEGFISLDGVVKAKSELYQYLAKHDGMAFVNTENPKQVTLTKSQSSYPISKLTALIQVNPFVSFSFKENHRINSQLIGAYNFDNLRAAAEIGVYFGVKDADIITAIEDYKPDNKRSELIQKGTTNIILDAYNANPTSMEAAIKSFDKLETTQKILILGDMFELGENASEEHQKIADMAEKSFETIYLLGSNFYKTKTSKAIKYPDYIAFKQDFVKNKFNKASILIKGSRGMALERIVTLF
jgi:UDP-N-acetylmuramoyl-tripeptide--D-alanyl-D-alanine ligase